MERKNFNSTKEMLLSVNSNDQIEAVYSGFMTTNFKISFQYILIFIVITAFLMSGIIGVNGGSKDVVNGIKAIAFISCVILVIKGIGKKHIGSALLITDKHVYVFNEISYRKSKKSYMYNSLDKYEIANLKYQEKANSIILKDSDSDNSVKIIKRPNESRVKKIRNHFDYKLVQEDYLINRFN